MMIGQSIFAMTVIDLIVIGGAVACLWTYPKYRPSPSAQKSKLGSSLLLGGILVISLLYVGDLATMHLLPLFMPHAEAMAIMRDLHLHYAWVTTITGMTCIISGYFLFKTNTHAILEKLERSQNGLRAELAARLSEQAKLNISEANLEKAQRNARIGSWNWNLVTGELQRSNEFYHIFGIARGESEAAYTAFLERVHPEDREMVDNTVTKALRNKVPYSIDHRIVLPGGEEKVIHAHAEMEYDDAGKPILMSGFAQDITERHRTEQALREAEHRFRDFAEAASDWFWEMGPDLRFTWVSDQLTESSGFPRDHYIGKSPREIGAPLYDREGWERYIALMEAHEPVHGFYFTRPSKDGSERNFRLNAKPVFAPDGSFQGYRGTGREFTTDAGADERIHRARDRFVNAIEYISEGMALFDGNERLVVCNSQFLEFAVASTVQSPIGISFEDLVTANVQAGFISVPEPMADEWIAWRVRRFRDSGEPFELVVGGRHLLIHEQRLPESGTIYVSSDISEIKEREEQLRQSQKMEVVGQMTGGVAHDFNNVLAVISGNLELLGEKLAGNEEHQAFVRKCLDAADRGAALTQRLLAFSRKTPLAPQTIDVAVLMQDLPSLLNRTLGENITVEIAVPDDLSAVFADPVQLENAILNLAVNARDAMPSGGKLIFEAANRTVGEEDARRSGVLTPGQYVMVAVSDTGKGMPRDVVEKAFEPFFTTKPTGKGSGLGLSMVYGFSRQSRGDVFIYSEEGRGTSIKIMLPVSENGAATAKSEDRAAIVEGKGESILVVEDDPAVRELAIDLLNSLNYNVIVANDGPDALEIIDTGDRIDLLFTDIVLPRAMDGVELARQAVSRRPGLKVLYTSGYTENAFKDAYKGADGPELLNKPYHKAALSHSIRHALDRPIHH